VAISSPGIGSNLDVNSIVSQLMSIEQQPLVVLSQKEASYQAQLSAIGNVKSALSTFQNAVKSLSDISKFQALKATSADSSIVSVVAGNSPAQGTYSLEISKLAQAQKLVSVGQTNTTDTIGTGTITIDFGTITVGGGSFDSTTGKYTGASFASNGNGAKTVTIDSSHSSLAGIRDAINSAGIGVSASIVNDGSATPNRLVLTDLSTGKTNSMKISVSGDAALGTLLNHDPGAAPAGQAFSETVTAQNAEFKVDGVSVTKTSNTVSDVIAGVTLSLAKTTAVGTTTSVTVARDSSTIVGSVGQFAFAYNQIFQTLRDVSAYNATTKKGAALNGDATVRVLQNELRKVLNTPVSGGASAFTLLSQIGVSFQKDGTLSVDNAKLQKAIDSNFTDVAGLFAAVGKPSDSLVAYSSATANTKPDSYALNITQVATHGTTVGQGAANLTIDGTNDTLVVNVDGISANVTLDHAVYASAAALATAVQAKINGATAISGASLSVSVTESGGVLSLTSASYGSSSKATITGGTGKSDLVGAAPTETTGVDVAGTLNGIAGTGSGQFLTGLTGDASEGLRVQVTGGVTGARGAVNYSQGYAYQFDKLADGLLSGTGPLSARTNGINSSLKSISSRRDALNIRLANIEKQYRAQFTALDVTIASMNKTSTFLTQQLNNLPKIS
jgi:flagellar hook-associated protein 2